MKAVRSVAYAVIVICALLCIVIAFYATRKPKEGEDSGRTETTVTESATGTAEDSSVPNLADLIKEHPTISSKPSISGNLTGEIDYDEIVKRQDEELDRVFRETISDYNKKYGISTSTTTSTTTTTHKEYNYFVNKATKIIHRIDCLLKPVNSSDTLYYETITDANKAGYTERCPVCSP